MHFRMVLFHDIDQTSFAITVPQTCRAARLQLPVVMAKIIQARLEHTAHWRGPLAALSTTKSESMAHVEQGYKESERTHIEELLSQLAVLRAYAKTHCGRQIGSIQLIHLMGSENGQNEFLDQFVNPSDTSISRALDACVANPSSCEPQACLHDIHERQLDLSSPKPDVHGCINLRHQEYEAVYQLMRHRTEEVINPRESSLKHLFFSGSSEYAAKAKAARDARINAGCVISPLTQHIVGNEFFASSVNHSSVGFAANLLVCTKKHNHTVLRDFL
jgi:hypothetical protein